MTHPLKDRIVREVLPRVQLPGQYIGGELNAVVKDHAAVRGKLCLAFPDAYTIGMSHHGLQVLYTIMNRRPDWLCERVFSPMPDMEALLREKGLPLVSLETFTPMGQFDVLGFTLQYELCATNLLAMLDLAGIPRRAEDRQPEHPLVIGGGPGVANPEPLAPFFDLFVVGDGEESLPAVCDGWLAARQQFGSRLESLAALAGSLPFVYVPRLYRPSDDGMGAVEPVRPEARPLVEPSVIADLDAVPLPTRPIVPFVECVQDRITIEIMRGCPGRCRFCQSNPLKRPLRYRQVDTILRAAIETYENTGYNVVALLSLSTSDYPHFDELLERLSAEFLPRGVSISLPSLRVNEQWRTVAERLGTFRHSGLTLAPEAALDPLRRRIGKQLANADVLEGCRRAFESGFHRVKLYFMCGLPGETEADLDGIVDMAEEIARLGKQVRGRWPTVVANVSNFVPKPQTPFQWNAMQQGDYFVAAHDRLRRRLRLRAVQLRCHDLHTSLLEAALARSDRRMARTIELAYQRGARLDAWTDHFQPELWSDALRDAEIDVEQVLHSPRAIDARLPWDHIS
ncbi:MAG: TIGR03960 family B12-binding radical SAM protein, partial [Thermoguttaceae bacterium]|nr:TIGR03960 family B12-binding radical SAM protein [Thermoguttaceae bacterium]